MAAHAFRSLAIAILLMAVSSTAATAQDPPPSEEPIVLPINISLVPGISIGDAVASSTGRPIINKTSFNLIAGRSYALEGVEFGTVWNANTGYVRGAQFTHVLNTVGGSMRGAQFAGVGNFVEGPMTGFQSAGVVNTAYDVVGMQASGVFGLARGDVSGIQASGVASLAEGYVDAQFSGVVSLARSFVRGVQVSGVTNITGGDVRGVQIAGVANIARGAVDGVQIGGVVNAAPYVSGLQIGVVNVAREHDGVPIGLVSYVHSVGVDLDVWADETGSVLAAVRSGTRSVSNYLGGGAMPGNDVYDWAFVAGLGYEFGLSRSASGSVDVLLHSLHTDDFADHAGITRLRFATRFHVHPHVSLFLGPTFNVFYSTHTDGSEVAPWSVYETSSNGHHMRLWPGFNAGVRLSLRAR